MNTSSLELCEELYELSGWDDTEKAWFEFSDGIMPHANNLKPEQFKRWICRAYDLGYLLRKLPKEVDGYPLMLMALDGWTVVITYDTHDGIGNTIERSDTPEDAACKLAINLFKQGILTKEANA